MTRELITQAHELQKRLSELESNNRILKLRCRAQSRSVRRLKKWMAIKKAPVGPHDPGASEINSLA